MPPLGMIGLSSISRLFLFRKSFYVFFDLLTRPEGSQILCYFCSHMLRLLLNIERELFASVAISAKPRDIAEDCVRMRQMMGQRKQSWRQRARCTRARMRVEGRLFTFVAN